MAKYKGLAIALVLSLLVSADDTPYERPPSLWRRTVSNVTVKSMDSNVETIDYFSSLAQALDYLLMLIESEQTSSDFLNYGCWCHKVGFLKDEEAKRTRKGGATLDMLDQLCQEWTKCMRCVALHNKATNHEDVTEDGKKIVSKSCDFTEQNYVIGKKSNGALTCNDPLNYVRPCAYESCSCGLNLIVNFIRHKEAWTWAHSAAGDKTCRYKDKDSIDGGLKFTMDDYYDEYDTAADTEDLDYYGYDFDGGFTSRGAGLNPDLEEKKHACCGKLPDWRPYKVGPKSCCGGEIFKTSQRKCCKDEYLVSHSERC